jgi:putative heme-binding domain-containing protein
MRLRFASKFTSGLLLVLVAVPVVAQSIPKEREITHREQSLTPYDPFSADELFKRIQVPPSPPLSPAEALKSFRVAPGFRLECVAAEPLVVNPVMFEFDPDGRIWVVEMRGYMRDLEGSDEGAPIGRIVVLEDMDGDRMMDRSTVYLDKLVMPRTLSFVQGGVLVVEPPNLWYCRDTDGDLKCDEKRLVGKYGRPGNPQHTENGLFHALDNWMYSADCTIRHKFVDGKLIEEPIARRGQWGVTQDDFGRLFYDYENSSLHADLIPEEYTRRNDHFNVETGRRHSNSGLNIDIAGSANEVFPIRVNPGITLGGTELREDGRLRTFTIACGPSIYRGDQFPAEFYGGAVIPEAGGNLVRFDLLAGDGVHLAARNAFDRREWIASTDERFRPVCSRTGPDGAVYIGDMYRAIIEHVIFMMPYLRNQILSRGLDKPFDGGRIYRIAYEGKPLGPAPRMSAASSQQLVRWLSHPNGWWRDTAQRLLVERKAIEVAGPLRALAATAQGNLARLHALWTLDGIDRLDWPTVKAALASTDPMVRATAIRLSERFREPARQAEVLDHLKECFADARPMVQLQLLLTLGQLPRSELAEGQMAEVLGRSPDPVFLAAAASGLKRRELEMITRLIDSAGWTVDHEQRCGAIETLATCVVHEGDSARVERLLSLAAERAAEKGWVADAIVAGVLNSELSRSRWPEPIVLKERPRLLSEKRSSTDALARIFTWPGDVNVHERKPVLSPLTPAQEKRLVLGEAVYNVTCIACHKENGRGQTGQAPPLVDSEWVNGPYDRLARIVLHGIHGPVKVSGEDWDLNMPGLGNSPVMSDERLAGVLTYVRRAWDNYGEAVDPEQVAAIRRSNSGRATPWTAPELLSASATALRPSVPKADPLEPYRGLLGSGDAEKGRFLFHSNRAVRCNACHTVGNLGGGFVGPDLTEVGKRADREYLLESLIDPSARIAKGFETLVVVTDDGRIVSGTFVSEDHGTLVVAPPAGGKVEIAVERVAERVQSPISSMPPMGNTFTPQQIADLVAYLESLKSAATVTAPRSLPPEEDR